MIIDCIIIAIANVHTVTCPVCIKYRRQTVIWSERRNGFILSTRALGSARALWPGQARTLESLSESESVSHLRISARDHTTPPRLASGEITISNSSWKIIRHPQEEDFHAC